MPPRTSDGTSPGFPSPPSASPPIRSGRTYSLYVGAGATPQARPGGVREQTTRERWHKVHQLLGQGVGLLDCSRRLGLALTAPTSSSATSTKAELKATAS